MKHEGVLDHAKSLRAELDQNHRSVEEDDDSSDDLEVEPEPPSLHRQKLIDFLELVDPERVPEVDSILAQYSSSDQMFDALEVEIRFPHPNPGASSSIQLLIMRDCRRNTKMFTTGWQARAPSGRRSSRCNRTAQIQTINQNASMEANVIARIHNTGRSFGIQAKMRMVQL